MRGRGAVNFVGDKSGGLPSGSGSGEGSVQTFGLGGGKVFEERIDRLEEVVNSDPGLLTRLRNMEQKIEQLEVCSS